MNAKERREKIIELLHNAKGPLTAKSLGDKFGVCRQVIGQDISVIRASGVEITSLVKGYVLKEPVRYTRVFKVIHGDDEVAEELGLIVDLGGVVEDVFVFHRVYGKLAANICIESREDIEDFLKEIASGKSSLLKNVTSGYHYHTVSATDEKILDDIQEKLTEKGFIAPLKSYEPVGMGESRY